MRYSIGYINRQVFSSNLRVPTFLTIEHGEIMLTIEKLPKNTYFIDEEWGYKNYLWTDTDNVYDPNKDYTKLTGVSERNFPGTLIEVYSIVFKKKDSQEIVYFDKSIKIDESSLKSVAYIVKTNDGLKAYCGDGLNIICVDVD